MFIAYTKQNKKFVENTDINGKLLTWEDIPDNVDITALALTHPVPVLINNQKISPKVSIKKFHYYYFFNEATITMMQVGDNKSDPEHHLQAKIIAGVDVVREFVLEIRLDKYGNTSCSTYPLYALTKKFDNGLMRKEVLRHGLTCPHGKNVI